MKSLQFIFITILICCNPVFTFGQNITINDTFSAQHLVENVLVNSSCASVSNSIASGDTSVPVGQNSYGYFTNAVGSFPFAEGIMLSTQYAQKSIGPYIWNLGNDNDSTWPGDIDLNLALGIRSVTATVLEFDFTPLTNFLSFDYIFASTEYADTGSCRFTDGFAFLIKENGSGSTYKNLAVIPGTSTPVSSTNIHPTIPAAGIYSGCPAINENYFDKFNNTSSPINYAGQTVIMNSQTAVEAGKSYHIKLVIANDFNEYYDSAVFLKAGSFAPKINLGSDRLAPNNPICFGESFLIDTQLSPTYSYRWYKDGSTIPIPGETGPSYLALDSGTYTVDVIFTPAACSATGQIKIEFTPEIILSDTSLTQCDANGNGISQFDLTKADNIIRNNNTSLSQVVYYESLANAKAVANPILNPGTYINKPSIPTLFARVTNMFNCVSYAQLNLQIANNTIASQSPIGICDGDAFQDGLYQFDLNAQVSPQVLLGLPAGMIVNYYLTENEAVQQKNTLPNIFKNTFPNHQIIYARIVNGSDCYTITPITLIVNTFTSPDFLDETISLCDGYSATLVVLPNYSSYLWSTGAISNSIVVTTAGTYSVIVTDVNGCSKTKKFIVSVSGIATITAARIHDFAGNNNSFLILYNGLGNYEFSIDGINYQDNPQFSNIAPGLYQVVAKDKNGCAISAPYSVYVMDYPRFFTPNGDGFNDEWKIKNLELFPNAILKIFDRYGKLLKELNANNFSWNGLYLGNELPSDDYWFQLKFDDNKIIKGHFSLKR